LIARESTLVDVCFAVASALEAHGISGILTGGAAAALYAPHDYASLDADFILTHDDALRDVAIALRSIGFERIGRSRLFSHPRSQFTIDFPKGPLSVGAEYIHETHVIERKGLRLGVLSRIDCIRDRLAHYYHWNDYTALNAAVGVAAAGAGEVDLDLLRAWTLRESPDLIEKFSEFKRRFAAYGNSPPATE
jgi:hypothetical protein